MNKCKDNYIELGSKLSQGVKVKRIHRVREYIELGNTHNKCLLSHVVT